MAAPGKSRPDLSPPEDWLGDLPPVEAYEDDTRGPPARNGHDHAPGAQLEARAPAGFRTLPNNIDAEQALLGAILVNNEAYDRVAAFLRPAHFYEPVHGRIYAAAERLIKAGRIADHVTMAEQFDRDPDLRELDGRQYLARMGAAAVTVLNAEDYGQLIHQLCIRRGVIAMAEAAVNKAYDAASAETPSDQLAVIKAALEQLSGEASATAHMPFPYVANDDLDADLPRRAFLVAQWVPLGCVTSLYGSGGTGKSFLAMMMAICVAAGHRWLGYECRRAPVLCVMCEDDEAEIKRRRNKIAKSLGISLSDIEDRLSITARVGEMNAMMEFPGGVATRTALFDRIVTEANRIGAKLVILDNAAQLFGGNENDRSQVTAFLNACAGIANSTNGAVILLGHPPKTLGVEYSGSTAWDAVVRSRIWFKRIEDEDEAAMPGSPERYTLELVKSNYEKRFGIELQENGSGIVEHAGALVKAKKAKQSAADKTVDVLRDLYAVKRTAITDDEIVEEKIRRGLLSETEKGSPSWRDKTRMVRLYMAQKRHDIDDRGNGSYALKPS